MNLLNLPNKIISDYPLLPLFDYVLNVVFGKKGAGRACTVHQTCSSFMSFLQ